MIRVWGSQRIGYLLMAILPFSCSSWKKFWNLTSEITAGAENAANVYGLIFSASGSNSVGEGSTGVLRNATVTLTFNTPMNAATLTMQASAGTCSGTVQLSLDNFATCQSGTISSSANPTFVITPFPWLIGASNYKLRLTTGVSDAAGNFLPFIYTQTTGFTTRNTGWLYVVNTTSGDVSMFTLNAITGSPTANGTATVAALPQSIAVDPNGK
jgi:hypothetical protein